MNNAWEELKNKAMNTEYPRWRRVVSTVLLIFFSLAPVMILWYLYFTNDNLHCIRGFVYFSVPWLVAQLIVTAHLYISTNVIALVRVSQKMVIGFGNMWLILFIFSIPTCP